MAKRNKKNIKAISPIFALLIISLVIVIASFLMSLVGFEAQKAVLVELKNGDIPYGVEMTLTTVNNALSLDGLRFLLSNTSSNFVIFQPLIMLLISLIAVGIGESSGLFQLWFSKLRNIKPAILTFFVLLVAIASTFFGEYAYLLLMPVIGYIYKYANRSPSLGIMTVFIGITIGFGAGFLANYGDLLLGNITQISANIERNNNYIHGLYSTIFISVVSSIVLVILGVTAIQKYLAPKMSKKPTLELEPLPEKGKKIANVIFVTLLLLLIYAIIPGLPFSGFLLDDGQARYVAMLMSEQSYFKQGIVYILAVIMMITGAIYGFLNGKFKNTHEYNVGLSSAFNDLGYLFVVLFFALQMLALFEWTNIGYVISARLIELIGVLQFSGLPLIIGFIIVVVLITLMIPSLVAKWNFIAPIAVPLFMRSNITPDFTQFVFKVADSIGKSFTPLFLYLIIAIGFLQKYADEDEKTTLFGTMKLIMPAMLMMAGVWLVIVIGWYIVGLPTGINTFPTM